MLCAVRPHIEGLMNAFTTSLVLRLTHTLLRKQPQHFFIQAITVNPWDGCRVYKGKNIKIADEWVCIDVPERVSMDVSSNKLSALYDTLLLNHTFACIGTDAVETAKEMEERMEVYYLTREWREEGKKLEGKKRHLVALGEYGCEFCFVHSGEELVYFLREYEKKVVFFSIRVCDCVEGDCEDCMGGAWIDGWYQCQCGRCHFHKFYEE